MILLDLYVPALDDSFDIQVDEQTPVGLITDEIAEMLQKKVRAEQVEGQKYSLCLADQGLILPEDRTLAECGVKNGNRLIIV